MKYLAHLSEDRSREQTLLEHLHGTARLASGFAAPFGLSNTAYLCGIAHDIGKYSDRFQRRIRGSGEKVDHATAGALEIMEQKRKYMPAQCIASAFCVSGHHTGLPDGGAGSDLPTGSTFMGKMKRKPDRDIEDYSAFHEELSLPPTLEDTASFRPEDPLSLFFGIRMLYSCLVDADYLDTERFVSDGSVERGGYASLEEMNGRLTAYMDGFSGTDTRLNRKRTEIRRILLSQSASGKGLFSLTVPTGGGKTLASMSFALGHALENKLSRIIYVIPYCSVIEQTQRVFSDVFGAENVVAHYANVEYNTGENAEEKDKRYLATENWDAPLILTTSVQFFESLYANRSSPCRKLHNIANSLIIFDEAQMLPVSYLRPCVSAISLLVKEYGCSAVLCTATQPALGKLFHDFLPGQPIRELYPGGPDDDVFCRVRYRYDGRLTDDELIDRLSEKQVLCIVNNRKQAQELYARLPEDGSFYLTTTIYPKHRREVLDEIRRRLKSGEPCRVVSTSLVEAGVDVDFPTVYRALAGLDSLIQSGGRCNREGSHPADESIVHIFDTERRPPDILRQNISATRRILAKYGDDIACPEAIRDYFEFLLYTLKGDAELDSKQILNRVKKELLPFESVSRDFHLIDSPTKTVYILCRDDEGRQLAHEIAQGAFSRSLWRRMGQYAVSVYQQQYTTLQACGALEVLSPDAAILTQKELYDEKTGLSLQPAAGCLLEL